MLFNQAIGGATPVADHQIVTPLGARCTSPGNQGQVFLTTQDAGQGPDGLLSHHIAEWQASGVHPSLIAANVLSLQGRP